MRRKGIDRTKPLMFCDVEPIIVGEAPSDLIERLDIWDTLERMAFENLIKSIKRIQRTVLFYALGINYAEYIKFKQIAGETTIYDSGNIENDGMKENVSRDE